VIRFEQPKQFLNALVIIAFSLFKRKRNLLITLELVLQVSSEHPKQGSPEDHTGIQLENKGLGQEMKFKSKTLIGVRLQCGSFIHCRGQGRLLSLATRLGWAPTKLWQKL
jgi:hypothetical protein